MTESYTFASVKAIGDDDGPGEFEAVLSTSTLDRDGEVIDAKAFDPLPESIPIFYHHDWKSGAKPIGKGVPFYEDDVVKVKGTFASTPAGQEVRTLVREGMVTSMSVGFLNGRRSVKAGIPHVTYGEVFEGSMTPIPINTTARIMAAKAFDTEPKVSRKAVDGSWEQRSQELYETLRSAYTDADWVETLATFDDRVIYEIHGGSHDDKQYQAAYTFDGNEVILGEVVEVTAVESLTVTTLSLSGDAGDAPAPAGASPAVEAEQAKAIAAARLRQANPA